MLLRAITGVALCRNSIANINSRKETLHEGRHKPKRSFSSKTAENNQKEFSRRLALLKAEVALDFPALMSRLESGVQVVWITDTGMAHDLEPEILRRLGAITIVCSFYGAAVIFVNENKLIELEAKSDTQS